MNEKGKRFESIRWDLEKASREFGIDPKTLSSRLKGLNTLPSEEDNRFSTKQIARAVFGDLEMERIRKTSAEADQIEAENKVAEGRLVDVDEFATEYEACAVQIVRIIKSSKLTESEQDEALAALAAVHRVDNEPTKNNRSEF